MQVRHTEQSACNLVFVIFRWRRFHSLPCGFVRFHHTTISCLWNLVRCIQLRSQLVVLEWTSFLHCMAASTGLSNFLLACSRVSVYSWFSIVDSSQSSSIVEFWLLVFPFLLISILSGFPNFRPNFWPYMIWSRSRLNLLWVSPWTTCILEEVLLSIEWILWILSKNMTNSCSRRLSYRQCAFLAWRPSQCAWTWLHQCISVE